MSFQVKFNGIKQIHSKKAGFYYYKSRPTSKMRFNQIFFNDIIIIIVQCYLALSGIIVLLLMTVVLLQRFVFSGIPAETFFQ